MLDEIKHLETRFLRVNKSFILLGIGIYDKHNNQKVMTPSIKIHSASQILDFAKTQHKQ